MPAFCSVWRMRVAYPCGVSAWRIHVAYLRRYAVYNTATRRFEVFVELSAAPEATRVVVCGSARDRGPAGPLKRKFKVRHCPPARVFLPALSL